MHKYERLEKLYYRRKIKKIFSILLLILTLFFIVWELFKLNKTKTSQTPKENNLSNISKTKNISISKSEKNISKKIVKQKREVNKEKKEIQTPVFSFQMPKIDFNEEDTENKKAASESHKNVKKKEKEETKKQKEIKKIKKKREFVIVEEKASVDDLIKSFNKNPSFNLAIQISNYYLNKNQLDLAKLWALKANNIDASRYESWKIFAIILLKKNKKEKAKEVLKTYINNYGRNEEIDNLLRSIDE